MKHVVLKKQVPQKNVFSLNNVFYCILLMQDVNFNTSEFLNYLITNYTSCYIYTEVGTAPLRVARYIYASVARAGSGSANFRSAMEFIRYSAAASFPVCISNAKKLNLF